MSLLLNVDALLDEVLSPSAMGRQHLTTSVKPTVLIASSLATVRSVGRTVLESSGYRVLLAADGYVTAAAFQTEPGIGLAFLDESLPHSPAMVLAKQLRDSGFRPKLILLCRSQSLWVRFRTRYAGFTGWLPQQPSADHILLCAREQLPISVSSMR